MYLYLQVRWPTASLKKQNTMPKTLQALSMMRTLILEET